MRPGRPSTLAGSVRRNLLLLLPGANVVAIFLEAGTVVRDPQGRPLRRKAKPRSGGNRPLTAIPAVCCHVVQVQSILAFVCPPSTASDPATLVTRYQEISAEPVRLFAAPAEQRILDKLIWPLRHAKASYMVGNYLAVIALCGMVAEMLALLLWEVSEVQLNAREMSDDDEKALFGTTFERLGQERRIQVLSTYGLIDSAARGRFDTAKEIRRRYLHLWSQDHDSLPGDAVKSYYAAVALVATAIGQDVSDGKIVINSRLVKYLERQGVYSPREAPAV